MKVISCNPDMLSSGEKKNNDNSDWTVQKRTLILRLIALWTWKEGNHITLLFYYKSAKIVKKIKIRNEIL